MEILSIKELGEYQDNMRNVIIMIFKGIGLCGMDKLLITEGEDAQKEAGKKRGRSLRKRNKSAAREREAQDRGRFRSCICSCGRFDLGYWN